MTINRQKMILMDALICFCLIISDVKQLFKFVYFYFIFCEILSEAVFFSSYWNKSVSYIFTYILNMFFCVRYDFYVYKRNSSSDWELWNLLCYNLYSHPLKLSYLDSQPILKLYFWLLDQLHVPDSVIEKFSLLPANWKHPFITY